MNTFSYNPISLCGLFYGREGASMGSDLVVGNVREVADTVFVDLYSNSLWEDSSKVCSAICSVLPLGRFSEIAKSIVYSIAIDVIDLILWPFSSYVKPRKPMAEIAFSIYGDFSVGSFMKFPGLISWENSMRAMLGRSYPEEIARIPVVSKNLTEFFGSKQLVHIGNSHDKCVVY